MPVAAKKKNKAQLTRVERLKVVEGARRLLGAKGQNWIKGAWFGHRDKHDAPNQPDPEVYDVVDPKYDDLDETPVNCWCLLGALEESAWRLGYLTDRDESTRMGPRTSMQKIVEEMGFVSIDSFNDFSVWKDVRKALDKRVKQLRSEIGS